ncbi:fatty acid desaturase [Algoriphagus sp. D3-2-R+10]|uniref:fatty acid desaturase n=1 Tax=Algoriphagus aurantiacus TaxID=3103948 RepID=UPI002B383D60|nr:fatty acid desaturase [Algoriphagus sp. D3-2-R+10]MEB2776608.1 fatty acid desaturase [Algoriphagus sp. D3-2-R+10]
MKSEIKRASDDPKGVLIALAIISLWFSSLIFLLNIQISWTNPLVYLGILIQMHLYTGLFITAHDAMHGLVSSDKKLNKAIGWTTALLFSYNFYSRLLPKHHEHHRFVATDQDPDYHDSDNFIAWYYNFIKQYVSIWQILLMAVTFNVLKLFLPTENLIVFWMLPAVLSTFQLFYFGTYLPHRGENHNKHHSSTQSKNHVWAFISCYFFGYHYEHHDSPGTPWWKLWRIKESQH